ncbi:hypothetical protein CSIM01_03490 [Colletotrichum simmondsii]|uniref:Nucleoside phosphorylase domain-containing protein n=1 Tax=Colletotrichum simmondsii TaxID=703756 RepID=A0A135RYU3_9PEZI|nr:hypothetical protein CSIM01_03490 [Colletotrichum simmondsii]
MSDPSIYTIGWICAIVPEFVAARLFLDEVHEEPRSQSKNDSNSYKLGRMGNHNVVIAVLPHGEYGESSAAVVARDMIRTFENIRVGLMVGIGGGAPSRENDIRLGDIVVSSPSGGYGGVLQYDFGKSIEGGNFEMTGFLNQPPIALRTALNVLIADFEIDGNHLESDNRTALGNRLHLIEKYGRPNPEADKLFRSGISYDANKTMADYAAGDLVERPKRFAESTPVIHHGLIASANQVMKDARKRDKLAKDKNVLCFEMEAAGLMNQFPCLVVRGICDYSDSHKNKQWQGYAAVAAAAFAKALVCRIPYQSLANEQTIAEALSILKIVGAEVTALKDSIDHDTLARTIAYGFRDADLLGATFFFKRGERGRSSASLLFSTLSKQLVQHRPELNPFVVEAIKQTDDISSKSLDEQFHKLILGPLTKAGSNAGGFANLVIIVEALDECSDEKDVEVLLPLLFKVVDSDLYGLKLLFTSRPEMAIREAFDSINAGSCLHCRLQDTPSDIISRDIAVYLEYQLTETRMWWNKRNSNFPTEQLAADWPGNERIGALVKISIPLFLFAAIACRFIRDGVFGSPEKQLLKLIQVAKEGSVHDKFAETYRPVLRQLQQNRTRKEEVLLLERFKNVIGTIILLEQPLATGSIASLLSLQISEVSGILSPLKSVLDIPEEQGKEVKVFHLSFRDFLLSPGAEEFFIDYKKTHWQIAVACLNLLSKSLRFNIGNLKPADRRSSIAQGVLEEQLQPHVRYACLSWFHHLKQAGKTLEDGDVVHEFLQHRFLHWIEALSILGEAYRGVQMPEILIPNVFGESIPACIASQHPRKSRWTPLVQNPGFKNSTDDFTSIAISPDSRLGAFGVSRGEIYVWSLSTGVLRTVIDMPSDRSPSAKLSVTFFEDSRRIAAAYHDFVRVFVAETGETLHSFLLDPAQYRIPRRMGCNDVEQIDVSRDSERIAVSFFCRVAQHKHIAAIWTILSGDRLELLPVDTSSDDVNLRLTDTSSEDKSGSYSDFRSKTNRRSFVCFSPDSQFVATSSDPGDVDLWRASTGQHLRTFRTNRPVIGPLAFISSTNCLLVREAGGAHSLDIDTGCWLSRMPSKETTLETVAISHDARFIAHRNIADRNTISISLLDTGEHYRSLDWLSMFDVESLGPTSCEAAFSPDGKYVVVARRNNIAIWSLSMIQRPRSLEKVLDPYPKSASLRAQSCFIHQNGSQEGALIVSMTEKRTSSEVNMWSSGTGQLLQTFVSEGRHWGKGGADVIFSPDSKHVFFPRECVILNTEHNDVVHNMNPSHDSHASRSWSAKTSIIFSADSHFFALGLSHDFSLWELGGELKVRDSACGGDLIAVTPDWKSAAYTVEASSSLDQHEESDGASHARGWRSSNELSIRYLNIETGVHVDMPEKGGTLSFLAISPNSAWVASVELRGKEISLWSTKHRSRQALYSAESRITAIMFSGKSDLLASADKSQMIRIWSIISGQCTLILDLGQSLASLSFSADDVYLGTPFGKIAIDKRPGTSEAFSLISENMELENASVAPRKPRWQGYGVDLSGEWITWNGVNVIWLPTDISPSSRLKIPRWTDKDKRYCVAASGLIVAWVTPFDELYTMGFSRDIRPFD